MILFHLFGGTLLHFSDLERAIPAISQKGRSQCPALDALLEWAEQRAPDS